MTFDVESNSKGGMWIVLTVIAIVFLFLYRKAPNAMGGGITIGVVGGLIAALVYYFLGQAWDWSVIGKWIVVAMIVGGVLETVFWAIKKNA